MSLLLGVQALAITEHHLNHASHLEYPAVVRVYYKQPAELQPLVDDFDVWHINQAQKFATIQLNDASELQLLLQQNLPTKVDLMLMNQYQNDLLRIKQAEKSGAGIPGFACYSTVSETFQKIQQLETEQPNLVDLIDIGDSWEKIQNGEQGDDLRVIKITNENIKADKPILFMASSIHAREYATAELNTRFAQYLVNNYGIDADVTWILDNHEIHLSLITNPDGRKQAQTGILWRKNTNNDYCSNSNSRGVDLNRNYPFKWGIGGSENECSDVFYGLNQASEPEVASQMDYLRQIFEDNRGPGDDDAAADDATGIFIDIHSFGQLMLWPWGYTNGVSPNDNQLQAIGKRTAFINNYFPQPVNQLVITGGGSIDAVYGELGVASLAFELGTSFFQDCETFETQIWPDNLKALIYLARVTSAPYQQPLGPDVDSLRVIPNVITAGTNVEISGLADDDRYNQSNTNQAFQTVTAVHAALNEFPSDSQNQQTLAASDGAYDAAQEAFSGQLDTQNLNTGKNTVFVQASDGQYEGAVFARFIDVIEPSQVAQLSGVVRDALSGAPIAGALLSVNQSEALSAADGNYNQYVQAGTSTLQVRAEDYAGFSQAGLSLVAGEQLQLDIELQPFCEIFADDVEGGNVGWQADAPWAISTDQSNSPTRAWTDSPGSEYDNQINISLTSPTINIAGANSLQVSYMNICDTEAGYDYGIFEVQYDEGAWQEISRCDNQNSWQAANNQLNPPVNAIDFRLRFRLDTDVTVTRDGWHIDDVSVKASGPVCGQFIDDVIFANGFN
ncbi:M14 family zinc carboxypeptidase [Marinicella marina]|nr:M14 family zinc carboxypeptidase [Marinicella marina]MDJ1139946.1 M14 family zinc carboxypeptidase [Marinicella marina]